MKVTKKRLKILLTAAIMILPLFTQANAMNGKKSNLKLISVKLKQEAPELESIPNLMQINETYEITIRKKHGRHYLLMTDTANNLRDIIELYEQDPNVENVRELRVVGKKRKVKSRRRKAPPVNPNSRIMPRPRPQKPANIQAEQEPIIEDQSHLPHKKRKRIRR